VGEDEEATVGGSDKIVPVQQRQVLADDTTADGVHQEARVALEDLVDDDPPAWTEAKLRRILWVVGGRAPVGADGTEVNVAVEVVGVQEAVSDAGDELGLVRGPIRHG
uniref:Uncharacterized protein n=1 Tax=Triticum urartu TaxID=4572 RepID=A0A8R7Q030_TRIUA